MLDLFHSMLIRSGTLPNLYLLYLKITYKIILFSSIPICSKENVEGNDSEDDLSSEEFDNFDYAKAMETTTATIGDVEYTLPLISLVYLMEKNKIEEKVLASRVKRKIGTEARAAIAEIRQQGKAQKDKEVGLPVQKKRKRRNVKT